MPAALLAAVSFTLAGCQEHDLGFDAASIRYEKEFKKAFKDIDPNGTWNATRGGSVNVTVDEITQVMVYAKGLSVNLQLRCDVVEAGDSKTIVYDAPKGVEEVYVIAKNRNGWYSETVEVGQNKSVEFCFAKTRALPATYNYGVAHPISYVSNAYSVDNQPGVYATPGGVQEHYNYLGEYNTVLIASTGSKCYPYPTWGNLYAAYPWSYTSAKLDPVEVGLSGNRNESPFAIEHDDVTLSQAIQDAVRNVVGTADDHIEILRPYTQDIEYMTTMEPGQIELTLVSTQTNSSNVIGYYYTMGDQTVDQLKSVKKFVLIPSMGSQSIGDKFKLVYFGPNYDEAGTYDFPKGVKIHFFLSRKTQGNTNQTNFCLEERVVHSGTNGEEFINTTYTDFYGMNSDVTFFSDSELNTVAQESFSSFTFPATAAFNIMGQNCISFEDYPNAGSIDWNDAVFTIDAPFQDFSSFDEVESFVIAVEDLGDTYDFDYNDCVIRVQQSTTTLKYVGGNTDTRVNPATVTLLASGGTLPIEVKYNDETLIAETHAAFDVASTVPVNVNANGGASKKAVTVNWTNAPADLSLAVDAPKFKFIVTNEGSTNTEVHIPTVTEGSSTVPVAFVIPSQTWEWPDEGVNITTVYDTFETWVANNDDTEATYWYNYQWGKTYSTDPGIDPDVDPAEPEGLTDTKNATQANVSNSTLPKEFFLSELGTVTKSTITLSTTTDVTFYIKDGDVWALPTIKSQSEGVLTSGVSDGGNIFIPAEGKVVFEISSNLSTIQNNGWYIEEKVKWVSGTAYPATYALTIVNTYTTNQ